MVIQLLVDNLMLIDNNRKKFCSKFYTKLWISFFLTDIS